MTTFAINEAKIKLAWREKYLTDGANEQALAYPRGCYRGFWPIPRPVPDTFVRIAIDPFALGVDIDSFAIYADRTNGFSLSIRETADVDLDCALLFPVVGATEDWWVSIDATYTPNVTTTANYCVDKVDPRIANPDAIVLGVMPMTLGDITIHTAGVYTERNIPSPTARQNAADYVPGDEPWGLFDGLSKWCLGTGSEARSFAEPSIDSFALVGETEFQLSGEFYVGRDGLNTAGKYFRFMDSTTTNNLPLLGSDGGRIWPSVVVYLSDGITPINPGVDADAEGFYANPWLEFSFNDTVDATVTGTIRVLGYKKKTLLTLDNAPAGAFPIGDMEQTAHARWILAKSAAGTPETLSGGVLSDQLVSILGHINDRIETIHPTGAPGDWVLLWRSHNIVLDANVTKQTSSIYFGNKGLVLINGGYIKIADGDVYAAHVGAVADEVSIVYLRSGSSGGLTFGVKVGPALGSNWDVETGWDIYDEYDAVGGNHFGLHIFNEGLLSSDTVSSAGGAGNKNGHEGVGSGSGCGGKFTAGATGAAIRLVEQGADPVAAVDGDMWIRAEEGYVQANGTPRMMAPIKAAARGYSIGGVAGLSYGYNVSGCVRILDRLQFALTNGMTQNKVVAVASNMGTGHNYTLTCQPEVADPVTYIEVYLIDADTGTEVDLDTADADVSLLVFGELD